MPACAPMTGSRAVVLCGAGAIGLSCRSAREEPAMTAMIDMHAHWKPAEVADALRARAREPRIVRNDDGVEVLKLPRMGEEPIATAFDEVDFHLARMDRQGVETSVLSIVG